MTMRTTLIKAPLVLNLLVLSAGCGAGQTGDLSGNHDEGGGNEVSSGCEDHLQGVPLDDASAVGFSGASVLAFAAQSFETPVAWRAIAGVGYTPGAGRSTLTLTLRAAGDPSFVHSTPLPSNGELAVLCPPDRLRIPVHAELSTADGALLESFDTRIEASDPAFARLDQGLDVSALSGGFAVDSIDESVLFPGAQGTPELAGLTLGATLSEAGMAGGLTAQITSEGKGVSGVTNVTFASFPADAVCTPEPGGSWTIPVTLDDPTIGLTGAQAATEINARGPSPLSWSDGSKTSVTVSVSGLSKGCLQGPLLGANRPAPTAAYPVTVTVSTADGAVAGSYASRLLVERAVEGGYNRRLEVHREYAVSEADQTGFTVSEVPSGTQRLSVGIQVLVTDQAASGSLVLNGLSDPPCVTTPPVAMGGSLPGCAGTTVKPLMKGTWGSP